jgi:tellurite resistance protein TehA-like permease
MATGIVSVAAALLGHEDLSLVLLAVGAAAWVVLIVLTTRRAVRHTEAVRADVYDARKTFGFFTFVAGTGVLAARLSLDGAYDATLALWIVSTLGWVLTGYGLAWLLTSREVATDFRGVSGNWLLAVVATQSIAIGAADLARQWAAHQFLFAAFCLWTIGIGMYAVIIVLVVTRLFFRPMNPSDFTPDFWVSMGALAISTLAGSVLAVAGARSPVLRAVHPMVEGVTVATWAVGAWWIPYLIVTELWRGIRQGTMGAYYHPRRWAMVFPLGMFTAASYHLGGAVGLPELQSFSSYFFWVALAAWGITAAQALWALVSSEGVAEVA